MKLKYIMRWKKITNLQRKYANLALFHPNNTHCFYYRR